MRTKVILNPKKQIPVLQGHPWIFPKAIASIKGRVQTGEFVDIFDSEGVLLGVGAYNEHSLYRVRVLSLGNDGADDKTIIKYRLEKAIKLRQALHLPNQHTNAYRLFNSEADGLSGLTIDRFNQCCVVASSAYWVELNKELISSFIKSLLPDEEVLWLAQAKPLKQDGWQDRLQEPVERTAEVLEASVRYQVDFGKTQKTGLFLDQRENHQRIGAISAGKKVLDLYTYSGGFALHAAKGGASQVVAIDSSANAIEMAKKNAILNKLSGIEFIEADARAYLEKAGDFDLIILDPPKLVPSQQHIQKAKNYYRFLHREVFKHMRLDALLMTCNCSSALSTAEFCELISAQAVQVGKQAQILGVYGPSSCHPTLSVFPEGNYLTAVLVAVR